MKRRRQVLAAAVALRALQRKPEAPPRPRPVVRVERPAPPAVLRPVQPEVQRPDPPDYSEPIAHAEAVATRARKQAQAIADEAASLSERVRAVQGLIETLRSESGRTLQMLAAHREEVPRLVDPLAQRINVQREEMLGKVAGAESAAAASVGEIRAALAALEQRHAEMLASAVGPVRDGAAQALARADHAIARAEQALSREFPRAPEAPALPDCIVDMVVENDHLVGIYASGVRRDFGQIRFKGKAQGGGRMASMQAASFAPQVVEVSADYQVQIASTRLVLLVSAGNVTLPDAARSRNRLLEVKRIGGSNVAVTAFGAQLIDGLSTINLDTIYDAAELVSDGYNWYIL